MDFYIGWSHSDVIYSNFFAQCAMLISATPSNGRPLRKFECQPAKLLIDSGAVSVVNREKRFRVHEIFQMQSEIVLDASESTQILLAHVDEPLLNKKGLSEFYYAMEQTLFNAYEYMQLYTKAQLPPSVQPLGVIQGFDEASIRYSIHELQKMGYCVFGIGSMLTRNLQQQIRFIEMVTNIVGAKNLHVFGVTGMRQIRKMVELGVASFDSTRPTMAAAYYQVFYSEPFRTYVLDDSQVTKKMPRIETPLPCDCPICPNHAKEMLISSPRKYMKLRSIHNYYHLMKTIRQIQREKGNQQDVVSNVLWT